MKTLIILHAIYCALALSITALELTPAQEMNASALIFGSYAILFFICLPLMAGDTEQPAEKE